MKQNVNVVLLGLLLVMVFSITGLTLFYKYTYDRLDDRYDGALVEIQDRTAELNRTIEQVQDKESQLHQVELELLDYVNELNVTEEKVTSLGEHFTNLRGEKDEILDSYNLTLEQKEEVERALDIARQDLDVCEVDYRLKKKELENAERDITNIKAVLFQISDLQQDADTAVDRAQEKADGVSSGIKKIEGEANDITDPDEKAGVENELAEMEDDHVSLKGYLKDIENAINKMTTWLDKVS